ncbi:hypothetical protein K461DRAFT_6657 [Myriangium duriaei CBS 260.36]|uniref:Wax synthase domain-containing protein n=1 Tax=Myriangium duriaei CBS 260.36 TaxID=1168546 RepID=A0A9P4J896_9PEZI|nr:hypothetical protein K461DRAFT_6657 [Myriangium duriaei CBS 260.36]
MLNMADPIYFFFLAKCLMFWGMAYVPSASVVRKLLMLLIAGSCLIAVRSPLLKWFPGGVGGEYVIGWMLHASRLLCLVELDPPKTWSTTQKWTWSWNLLFSTRFGVTNPPPFNKKDPAYVPSRSRLFFERLWDLLWTGAVVWVLQTTDPLGVNSSDIPDATGLFTRLGHISQRELLVRIYLAGSSYVTQYLSLRAFHSLFSCVGLLCGQDSTQWPTLFGDLAEAYTLRRYYSAFWHYCMRKPFTSHSILFCNKILRLPRDGQLTRYMVLATSFMLSCIMHIICEAGMERCTFFPTLKYYVLVILAITAEDFIIRTYKWSQKALGAGDPPQKKVFEKVNPTPSEPRLKHGRPSSPLLTIGYAWVFCFHTWAASTAIFESFTRCFA